MCKGDERLDNLIIVKYLTSVLDTEKKKKRWIMQWKDTNAYSCDMILKIKKMLRVSTNRYICTTTVTTPHKCNRLTCSSPSEPNK